MAFDKNKLRVGKNGETPIIEYVVDDFIQYSLELIDYEKHIKKITIKGEKPTSLDVGCIA